MPTDTSTPTPDEDDGPCQYCGSPGHSTDGHFDGSAPTVPAGNVDGSINYATEPVHVDDDDARR